MSRRRIALVTTMYSPFQNDVGRAVRARGDIDYRIFYTMDRRNQRGENLRGKHWTADREQEDWLEEIYEWHDVGDLAQRLDGALQEFDPHAIVGTGLLRAPTYHALKRISSRRRAVPTGYWLEHPDLSRSKARRVAIEAVVRFQLRGADFVLAIGDRAASFYQRCAPKVPVHIVPYGQDLSHHFKVTRDAPGPEVTFLFSGQLLPRNNIRNLTRAFRRLAHSHPGRWRFVVAARGPEEKWIRRFMEEVPEAQGAISFDRDYETWLDRIRPFRNADVLLCPSLHAGWALVVPEAMAAGMPVIATRFVGAARYFVRPEVTGVICRTSVDSIYRALVRFVEEPLAIRRMGEAARVSADAGRAEYVADRLSEAVLRHAA